MYGVYVIIKENERDAVCKHLNFESQWYHKKNGT